MTIWRGYKKKKKNGFLVILTIFFFHSAVAKFRRVVAFANWTVFVSYLQTRFCSRAGEERITLGNASPVTSQLERKRIVRFFYPPPLFTRPCPSPPHASSQLPGLYSYIYLHVYCTRTRIIYTYTNRVQYIYTPPCAWRARLKVSARIV